MAADDKNSAYAAAVKAAENKHYDELLYGFWGALSELDELDFARSDLRVLLQANETLPSLVKTALDTLDKTATAMRRELTKCEDEVPVWTPTERSTQLAQQVFGIVELCEQILGHLGGGYDLRSASQMCGTVAAMTRGSPILQHVLGLTPNTSGFWHAPFAKGLYPGFSCDKTDYMVMWASSRGIPDRPTIEASFNTYRYDNYYSEREYTKVIAMPRSPNHSSACHPKGLTVGDLYDETVRLMEEHRLCPYEQTGKLDKDGFVRPQVTFKTTVQLLESDPELASRRKEAHDFDDEGKREAANLAMFASVKQRAVDLREGYTDAKHKALLRGMPIPTLAEYTTRRAAKAKNSLDLCGVENDTPSEWSAPNSVAGLETMSVADWGDHLSNDDGVNWGSTSVQPTQASAAPNALQPGVSYAAMASRGLSS
ncbi:hypothetical protein LTR56_000148 [Elasticomyces elasticus]|nr:hypothetical protein LTR56_000148 [Elasticomyces elasticus]KAK3667135.1 hypothetical protein LTR22_002000 [Elasticomyces elasticus]KAK4932910.1 hypothetical protein LTR49_000867 [Elasticomyces elasticus]KAK5768686.1 hypothetical protein LTS12_001111 [Elasticomyces elasticus]